MNLKPPRVTIKFGRAAAVAKQLLREEQAMRRAARLMPRPVPWEWAKPRIVPLLAGPNLDGAGEPLVRAVAAPGCALVFGLEVGQAYPLVDEVVAQRWECTAEQIHEVGMANLGAGPRASDREVHSERNAQRLDHRPDARRGLGLLTGPSAR